MLPAIPMHTPGRSLPADSPYVTVVGGTTLTTGGPGGVWVSETVWNWGGGQGSGGGISTAYSLPPWQENLSTAASQGSSHQRNIPDVAMVADNIFEIDDNGKSEPGVGGTSCATPLWAGFTALVNQQATASGKPTMGSLTRSSMPLAKPPATLPLFMT